MSLAAALERAAAALPELADAIRPANGDPRRLLEGLDGPGSARLLGWLLEHEPEAGAELALGLAEEEGGDAPLLALRTASLSKPGRKALGRALHRLRSRGVNVPEAPSGPTVAKLRPLADELSGSYVSGLDPSGARLVLLLEPNPGGGARLFELVADERRGILDCHVYTTARRDARRFVRELVGRKRLSVVEAPREAVQALLTRIASRRDPERTLPRSFEEWRSRLASPPPGARSPGELAREAFPEDGARAALERVATLVREREIGPWPPSRELLESFADRLREAAEGRVIVTGAARRERLAEVLGGCVEDAFGGAAAEVVAAQLRETAYVFWKDGREEDARACIGAARAFESQPVADNPVGRALLEWALGPLLEKLEAEEDTSLLAKGDPSLLAKPR